MITSVLVTILAAVALLAFGLVLADRLTRPREPTVDLRPFRCDRCACSFRNARWPGMHMRAQHPETYDGSR